MQPRLVEPLIRTYGAFRVRQLILEIEGREPHTLDVCRLTLASDDAQEVPLKTIHNTRIDLSWVVYAVREYQYDLRHLIRSFDEIQFETLDPVKLAESLHRLSDVSDDQWAKMIAREHLTAHPRQRELMDVYCQQTSEALRDLHAIYPESVADRLDEFRTNNQELDRVIRTNTKQRRQLWGDQIQRLRPFERILGRQVFESGPFHVFEDFGCYTRTDVNLTPLQQREDSTWVNATYGTYFYDGEMSKSGSQDDSFAKRALGLFTHVGAIGRDQVCEAVDRWLAEERKAHQRNREWAANYMRTMKQESGDETFEIVGEESDQFDEEYQAIYMAWIALGCEGELADSEQV